MLFGCVWFTAMSSRDILSHLTVPVLVLSVVAVESEWHYPIGCPLSCDLRHHEQRQSSVERDGPVWLGDCPTACPMPGKLNPPDLSPVDLSGDGCPGKGISGNSETCHSGPLIHWQQNLKNSSTLWLISQRHRVLWFTFWLVQKIQKCLAYETNYSLLSLH